MGGRSSWSSQRDPTPALPAARQDSALGATSLSTGRWPLPPGSQADRFSQTQGSQTPAGKGWLLKGEPLAVRQPLNRKGSCELLGELGLPCPAPMAEVKGPSTTGEATCIVLRPALLEGPVLEETHNPWSVKRGKQLRLAWFPSSP